MGTVLFQYSSGGEELKQGSCNLHVHQLLLMLTGNQAVCCVFRQVRRHTVLVAVLSHTSPVWFGSHLL